MALNSWKRSVFISTGRTVVTFRHPLKVRFKQRDWHIPDLMLPWRESTPLSWAFVQIHRSFPKILSLKYLNMPKVYSLQGWVNATQKEHKAGCHKRAENINKVPLIPASRCKDPKMKSWNSFLSSTKNLIYFQQMEKQSDVGQSAVAMNISVLAFNNKSVVIQLQLFLKMTQAWFSSVYKFSLELRSCYGNNIVESAVQVQRRLGSSSSQNTKLNTSSNCLT